MGRSALTPVSTRALALALVACAAPACQSSSSPPNPARGTSGALAVVDVDGRSKAYVYYGPSSVPSFDHAQIAVVDVGVAGNGTAGAPARIGLIDVGPGFFGMAVAANDRQVVASGIVDPRVYFVDPRTDRFQGKIDLGASYQQYVVSDRDAYVISIAIDSPSERAFLAVWNGVAVVDLRTRTIVSTILAAPTENLAYDHTRGWLLAPFYDCALATANPPPPTCGDYRTPGGASMQSGLNLIDVRTGAVYTYQDAGAADPAAPVGVHPDGVAVDPGTGLLVLAPEGSPRLLGIDLSRAVLDPAAKSFTAPSTSVANPPPVSGATDTSELTAVAVSEGGTFSLALREFTSEVGLTTRAALTSGGSMILGTMPDLPGARPWLNRGDPHGITYARIGGRDVAVLVNSDQDWMARIDLATLAGLAHADPNAWTAVELAPAITYLDMTTAL